MSLSCQKGAFTAVNKVSISKLSFILKDLTPVMPHNCFPYENEQKKHLSILGTLLFACVLLSFLPMQRAVHLIKLRRRTPDTSKQTDFFITTDTIRASMGEPLFLHFLTANKRLNLVLPFLKHLDKCVSSCLTHVLSY